jgi:hypothetical protein
MEEKSMKRNHEGEMIGRRIIEKESLRRHRGGEIMEQQSLRREHGGISWGASGSPLGTSGSICLGVAWEHLEGLKLRKHLGDIWRSNLRNRCTSQLKCESSIQM